MMSHRACLLSSCLHSVEIKLYPYCEMNDMNEVMRRSQSEMKVSEADAAAALLPIISVFLILLFLPPLLNKLGF